MEIIINGKQAFLKKNTSFDFIFENRLFTGSDSYTLTITFPLKGCARNIAIFGHIHRADVIKSKVVFDCDIRDGAFLKSGSITITEISDVEVKTQFLEGRSEQNFDETFDDIYLNEMELGYPVIRKGISVAEGITGVHGYVALPWVNNHSGLIHNPYTLGSHVVTGFEYPNEEHTFQPYLIHILKEICKELDYTYDFSNLEHSQYSSLLICNTLPASWAIWNFAKALPHWTLTEFFEQLEHFLFGEFDINHKARTITFNFSNDMAQSSGAFFIDRVIDSYTVEVSQDDESKYLASCNLKYADNNSLLWDYYTCDWYVRANKRYAVVCETLNELIKKTEPLKISGVYNGGFGTNPVTYCRGYLRDSLGHKMFYCKENDTYFVMFCYKSEFVKKVQDMSFYRYYNRLLPINQFGPMYAGEEADDLELKIVPAWIEGTDDKYGNVLFLDCGEMGDTTSYNETTNGSWVSGTTNHGSFGSTANRRYDGLDPTLDYNAGDLAHGKASLEISKGEKDKGQEYFSCIYVGFWDGSTATGHKQPHPIIDKVEIFDDFSWQTSGHTLRLNEGLYNSMRSVMHKIDGKQKFHFSFLSDTIPNPRALFYIRGQRYICEKITATFHESGKSQLLKGIFYRVLAD